MALCEYAAQVDGQFRASGENPGSSHCISIPKCDKAIKSHLRSFGAGFADFFLREQACINTEIFGNVNAVGFLLKPELASVSMFIISLG